MGGRLAHYLFHEHKLSVTAAWALGAIYAGKLGLAINPSLATLVAALCTVFSVSPIYVGVLYLRSTDDEKLRGPGYSLYLLYLLYYTSAKVQILTQKTLLFFF